MSGPCSASVPSSLEPGLADPRPTDPSPSDATLVHLALAGDDEAFRSLYRRHSPRLRGLIHRLVGRARGESDDVLQIVWQRAMRGVAAFRWNSTLSSWLCGIAVRASMESLRDGRRRTVFTLDLELEAPVTDIVSRLDIENAIATLPDHHRVVFLLHDVQGFTHEEIANQLGIAVGTSKSNLHRARRVIRSRLASWAAAMIIVALIVTPALLLNSRRGGRHTPLDSAALAGAGATPSDAAARRIAAGDSATSSVHSSYLVWY